MTALIHRALILLILLGVGSAGTNAVFSSALATEVAVDSVFVATETSRNPIRPASFARVDFQVPAESLFQAELRPISQAFYSSDEPTTPTVSPSSTVPPSWTVPPSSTPPLSPTAENRQFPPPPPEDAATPLNVVEPTMTFARPRDVLDVLNTFHANKLDFLTSTDETAWYLGGLGRAYYLNDQRYEFTGNEQTFGAQGVVEGGVRHVEGDWILTFESQFFLNQPYDRNLLQGSAFLDSFQYNFQVDPFQISLMTITARKNHFLATVGRFVTPFGRFYYPIYSNNFWDSPFIREQSILYRETGVLLQWDPEPFIITAAITNGGFEQDTNSSKALISRIGLYGDSYAVGSSIKLQDGIGSEQQKECNSHIGVDAMYRWKRWTLSSEAIIDYYGMNRSGFDPNTITWGRSIYFREDDQSVGHPLVGYGYYLNLEHAGDRWQINLNYGDYLPQKIGDPRQDTVIHRALIKATRHVTRHLDIYSVTLLENLFQSPVEITPGHYRTGFGLLVGLQYSL